VTLVLGVDGGGSKTHAMVADVRGETLGFASSGRSNWEDAGLGGARAALEAAITGALAAAGVDAGDLAASAFGLAGLDWDSDRPMLAALIDPLALGGPRRLDNDSFIALRAGTSQPFGVVVIAGTGTVAAGRDPAGRTFRTFGLEPMYGDFGSATDVAEEAVHAVADAYTGRGPATTLSELLPPLAGCASPVELLQRLSRGAIPLPPAAPLVLGQAAAGDPACREIVMRAGAALGSSAALVARRLGLDREVFETVMVSTPARTPCRHEGTPLGASRMRPRCRAASQPSLRWTPGRAKKRPPPIGKMYSSSGSPFGRACTVRNRSS